MQKILILFILLLSCSNPKEITTFSGNKMTIDYQVKIAQKLSTNEITLISSIIDNTFREVDTFYNKWNPLSEISHLNTLKAKTIVKISKELELLLIITDSIVKLTDGKFDPTIEPIQALWKKYLNLGKIPPQNEIHLITSSVGWDKIHFHDGYFYKDHDLSSIDLGGIAKGYLVDLLTEKIVNAGFQNIYVEWGGEIKTHGLHPENRFWNVFISNLGSANPEESIAIIPLKNEAIATSGDYLQNWTVGDVIYYHIINPKTLKPLILSKDNIASVSVIAPNCATADALATALMCFKSVDEANIWAETIKLSHPELSFWVISRKIETKTIVD